MSDPIFQSRSWVDGTVRGVGAFAIAPLAAVVAIALVYRVFGLQGADLFKDGANVAVVAFLYLVFVLGVGLSYALTFSALSTLMAWRDRKSAARLLLVGGAGSICFALLFAVHGSHWYTLLPSVLFFLIVGITAFNLLLEQVVPALRAGLRLIGSR